MADNNGTENGGDPIAPVPPSGYRPARLLADISSLLRRAGYRPFLVPEDLIDAVHQCEFLLELLGVPPLVPITYDRPPALPDDRELTEDPQPIPGQRLPGAVELDRPDDVDELEAD